MQIVIPMSGFGERFRSAGYDVPKPLIDVDGRPLISYVIDLFPGETDFIFICNQEHLDNPHYRMREIVQKYCKTGRIVGIPPHKKGPVYAVLCAIDAIKDDQPTIVNYCDFTCDWNYAHFKKWLATVKPDGCVPAYRGFHPHSLGSTFYAYIKQTNLWMEDIQEKTPYTDQPMNEYASSGTYYFATGKLMKKYFKRTVDENLNVNGEYYVSLTYKPLLADGLRSAVYALHHFMQWGTPQDLQEYLYWSNVFKKRHEVRTRVLRTGTLLLPMAGLGSRFVSEGYELPKPLIPVQGEPMVLQAVNDLPHLSHHVFVLRHDLPQLDTVMARIQLTYPHAECVILEKLTDGQARSCMLAKHACSMKAPLVIGACDNGVVYDEEKYQALLDDPDVDVIVWGVRAHPYAQAKPAMYGWIAADEKNRITKISTKIPLNNPARDPIVIGTFTFKKAEDFFAAADSLIARARTINGEYYVDESVNDAIAQGKRCVLFEVEAYLGWGTPNELKTFNYWQDCFHHWPHHVYEGANEFIEDPYLSALPGEVV